jgi:predicted MFS family arabinose efflux permease
MSTYADIAASRRTASTRSYRVLWVATLLFFGGFYALLVPLPLYLERVGLSGTEIGLVVGTFGIAALLSRPLVGALVDRAGARRVLLLGACALLVGSLGVPATSRLIPLLALRLLQALGYVAFTTAGTACVIALAPPQRRAQRLAIYGSAANVAITLTPAATSALLGSLPLEAGFAFAGALAMAASTLAALVPAMTPAPAPPFAGAWVPPRALWRPMLIAALFGASFAAFFQFVPLVAARQGEARVGWMYGLYGVGIIATRFGSGRLLGRCAPQRLLAAAACSLAAGLGLLAAAPPAAALPAVLLLAWGSGVSHPLLIDCHAALLPRSPGRATAAFYSGFDAGIGLGSLLFGALLQTAGPRALYGAAALLALAVLPLLAPPRQPQEEP